MKSTRLDQHFTDATLHSATIDLTFDQSARMLCHDIGAIHTAADGTQTRFRVQFPDAMRRTNFVHGLGAAIEAQWRARCDEVFERRRTGDAGCQGTPDMHAPAQRVVVIGAWDTSRTDTLVFIPAAWHWKEADGTRRDGGWIPESFARIASAA